jgi:hypothetical protein
MSGSHSWSRSRPSNVLGIGVRRERSIAGGSRCKNGEVTEGIYLLRSGSAAYRVTGAEQQRPHSITLLGRACEIAGQIEKAVTQIDDALQIVESTGERWLEAELYRHKGQLLLRQGIPRPPRNCIVKPSASRRSRGPSSGNCAPL